MCIIVDANRLSTFADFDQPDAKPIHSWLRRGGKVVYCDEGKFRSEMTAAARATLTAYSRAGMAQLRPLQSFASDIAKIREMKIESDDAHVLALARATRVRLLYSGDRKLIADFKNPNLINNPRGKVYTRAANKRLLDRAACPAR